jgi:hypothetical protein
VVEADDKKLAGHLARLDQELLSVRLDMEYTDLPEIQSGLHLLTLVDGWKLREDVLERCLCLRIFVLVTIFTATNWDQSVRTLAKWIRVAGIARTVFGDNFGFFSIVSALCNPHLAGLKMLWTCLDRDYEQESGIFNDELRPTVESLNKLSLPSPDDSVAVTVPHIVPFLSGCKDLKDRRTFRLMFREIFGDLDQGVDDPRFQAHIAQVQLNLGRIADFKANAEAAASLEVNGDDVEDDEIEVLLGDLFRTELHLRLLWGSAGSSAPAEERHAKFEKVIAALATICKNIERTLF